MFAQTAPPAAVPESLWQRWHLRWAVPITAAAAAVSIWIAIPEEGRRLDDAFTKAQPGEAVQPSAPEAEIASQEPPAPQPTAQENAVQEKAAQQKAPARAKSEPSPPADALSRREARSDAPSRSPSEARERERDAVAPPTVSAPAAPAATTPQQQARPLSDAAAGAARQSAEAFAQVEAVSPDGLVRWRIQPGPRLERSTTQGKTWDAVSLPQGVEPSAVRAPGAATAIVTATDGRQFRTDDQGKTWYLVQP